jgi:hypothetical protein
MQITIDNPFKEDDICISNVTYLDKKKTILFQMEDLYCKLRHKDKVKSLHENKKRADTKTFNKTKYIHIECIRKVGSRANK